MYAKKSNGSSNDPWGTPNVRVDIFQSEPLIEKYCFQSGIYDSNYLLHIPLIPYFFSICCGQQYQRPFENQQIYHEQKYLRQELSLLTQCDWKVHRKLNVVESQIAVNVLTCISQENHKSCYKTSFPRFYQHLIVVILIYSFSILILILFDELV